MEWKVHGSGTVPVLGRGPPHVDEVVGVGWGALGKEATAAGTTFCQLSKHCDPQFGGGIADVSLLLSRMLPFHVRRQLLAWCQHHVSCSAKPRARDDLDDWLTSSR